MNFNKEAFKADMKDLKEWIKGRFTLEGMNDMMTTFCKWFAASMVAAGYGVKVTIAGRPGLAPESARSPRETWTRSTPSDMQFNQRRSRRPKSRLTTGEFYSLTS